jgi:hypothetical protein
LSSNRNHDLGLLPFPAPVAGLADELEAIGAVVEYVLMAVPPDAGDEAELHRSAATTAVAELGRREAAGVPALRVVTDGSRATGARVTVAAFAGRSWDVATGELVDAWSHGHEAHSKPSGRHGHLTDGYAEAFVEPPHGLDVDRGQAEARFRAVNAALFGGLDDGLVVYEWSTDWSSWFDAGHEWWGAFLWTVRRTSAPTITAIAAAATD